MFLDLTLCVSKDNPVFKWAKSQSNPYIAMGHIGTHLDTYKKTKIPLEYFKSRAVIFDVRDKMSIDLSDIDTNLILNKDFVFFRTDWINKYPYGSDLYFKTHPELSDDLIDFLIKQKIRFIGIDCPGIKMQDAHEQADRKCEENFIYVIENLANLDLINKNIFMAYTMWIDDEAMSGLKCKVIAEID